MVFKLKIIENEDLAKFKSDIQEAFLKGFEDVYGCTSETILPENDIDQSLNTKGSIAYKAIVDNVTVILNRLCRCIKGYLLECNEKSEAVSVAKKEMIKS